MHGSTVKIALHYSKIAAQTAVTLKWDEHHAPRANYKIVNLNKGDLFDSENSRFYFNSDGKTIKAIHVWADKVKYNGKMGELLTTVTVRYPGHENVIRTRKLVMKSTKTQEMRFLVIHNTYHMEVDDDEETSGLFQ